VQGVAPFAFQGSDVLSWVPDGILSRSGQWTTPRERMDVPSGAFAVTAPALYPVHAQKAVYRCFSRADHAAVWAWLTARLGRYGAFWCPTFQLDFEVLSNAGATWIIRSAGYAAMLAADPSANHLYAFTRGGAMAAAATVTGAVDNGDGTETITWTLTGRGGSGSPADILATLEVGTQGLSLLRLARLDTDTLAQTWYTRELVDIAVSFATITGEQP
jgi:hypothetical protein